MSGMTAAGAGSAKAASCRKSSRGEKIWPLSSLARKRRALELESDLPIALRSIATQLNMRVPFERALSSISSQGYSCSDEFSRILRDVKRGASVREALSSSAERVDSITYKRALSQLSSAYEQGSRGDALKRLADDLISQQLAKEKELSSKLAIASILFIAVACVVPALLLAYLVVGASFLDLRASPLDVWLVFLVGFPLLDLLVIGYAHMNFVPGIAASKRVPLLSHRDLSLLAREAGLEDAGALKRKLLTLLSLCLLAAAALVYLAQPALAAAFAAIPFIYYFYLHYLLMRRNAELERYLPDALMQASGIEKGASPERILLSLSKSGYGKLSEEFRQALNSIRAGASFPSALSSISARNSSLLLERATSLMAAGYSLGSDACSSLRESAEDLLSVFAIVRERAASASLHKYTLLAGGIFVPFILGTLLSSISQLGVGQTGLANSEAAASIMQAAGSASQAYIAIYALLSSLLIAQTEGSWRRFFPYFIILAPLSLLIFSLASSHQLRLFS